MVACLPASPTLALESHFASCDGKSLFNAIVLAELTLSGTLLAFSTQEGRKKKRKTLLKILSKFGKATTTTLFPSLLFLLLKLFFLILIAA